MKPLLFWIIASILFWVSSPSIMFAQEAAVVGITKSVRDSETQPFSAQIINVPYQSTLQFQLIIKNFSSEALPSVRVIDVIPTGFTYTFSDVNPTDIQSVNNTTSILWIIRALQPGETRIINYQTTFTIDGKKYPDCLMNIVSSYYNGKVTDTSSVDVCPLGVNPRVLGAITTHPTTGIFDDRLLQIALGAFCLGTFGYITSQLLTRRYH